MTVDFVCPFSFVRALHVLKSSQVSPVQVQAVLLHQAFVYSALRIIFYIPWYSIYFAVYGGIYIINIGYFLPSASKNSQAVQACPLILSA